MEIFDIAKKTRDWLDAKTIALAFYQSVDSTNNAAKKEALLITDALKVYIAQTQTHGRGRSTNLWVSPPNNGALLSSWSFSLPSSAQNIAGPVLGLAVYQALSTVFKTLNLSIKAPNDIYSDKKKIAGILAEVVTNAKINRLVIGLGINVFSHPEQIITSGHISEHTKVTAELWSNFLHVLLDHLSEASRSLQTNFLTDLQRELLLKALNLYPDLTTKYTHVSSFGDLTQGERHISWREL